MYTINKLIECTRLDYKHMLGSLQDIKKQAIDLTTYIDVRLCMDIDEYEDVSWIIRSGDASYDQRHSMFCESSTVDAESDLTRVLEELINGVLDQASEGEAL